MWPCLGLFPRFRGFELSSSCFCSKHSYPLCYLLISGSLNSCHLDDTTWRLWIFFFFLIPTGYEESAENWLRSDVVKRNIFFFCKALFFSSPTLNSHPPQALDVWRKTERVGWDRAMSFLEFSVLSHAEWNLLIYSIRVSKKSKAFLVLISLKSYQTSFRLV